jgi:ring-1,2-phenylacetyl-CoA epoxidase subunit PaaE
MSNYYTLKVKEVIRESKDAITIQFKQPLFKKVRYKSGQFLTLIIPINGKKERRSYSICSTPDLDDYVSVMVKRVEKGLISNYLNDNIEAGDSIEVMEPMGNFILEPERKKKRHIVLFAAGSGITPLMSILKGILFFEPESTVSLLYGNRHEGAIIFRKELDQLKAKFGDRFNLAHTLTEYDKFWQSYKGRIDRAMTVNFVNLLPKFSEQDTEYFLCGPQGMMEEVREGLKILKVNPAKIHSESFFIAPANNQNSGELDTQMHEVTIHVNGETHKISVPPQKSILDTALDNGIDMPYSCQNGLCTACRSKCLSGSVKMLRGDGLSASEIAQGYVLTCVGIPATPTVEIEVG